VSCELSLRHPQNPREKGVGDEAEHPRPLRSRLSLVYTLESLT